MRTACQYIGTAICLPVIFPMVVLGFIIGLAVVSFRAGWQSVEEVASWMGQ